MKIMKIFFYFMLVPPPPPCSPWEQSLPPLQRSRGERRCFKLLLLAEEVRERRESKQKKKKNRVGLWLAGSQPRGCRADFLWDVEADRSGFVAARCAPILMRVDRGGKGCGCQTQALRFRVANASSV